MQLMLLLLFSGGIITETQLVLFLINAAVMSLQDLLYGLSTGFKMSVQCKVLQICEHNQYNFPWSSTTHSILTRKQM